MENPFDLRAFLRKIEAVSYTHLLPDGSEREQGPGTRVYSL